MEVVGVNRLSIRREIRWMVLPIIIESIFALSGNLVFIAFLGRIDSVGLSSITHVAAYGLAVIVTLIVWNLLKGISIGARLVSRKPMAPGTMTPTHRLADVRASFRFGGFACCCSFLLS